MQLLWDILAASLSTFLLAAPWILLGILAAGVLHVALPRQYVRRFMGQRGLGSVARAALFGVPLPVCSCGVVPLAIEMRRKGASRPATLSFLITTPESGAESILLTWGMLGPVMAVVRPVASFISAVIAGTLAIALPPAAEQTVIEDQAEPPACDHPSAPPADTAGTPTASSLGATLRKAARYAFVELLDDIAFWLVVGVLLTGVIATLFPPDLGSWGLGSGLLPMLLILVAAVPMYICASASTPVAAALLAKGLSPGAALVFLLAGPATNAASVLILGKNFGRGFVRIYLAGIVVGSVACGLALDALVDGLGLTVESRLTGLTGDGAPSVIQSLSAFVLAGLIVWRFRHGAAREGWNEIRISLTVLFGALSASKVVGARRDGTRRLSPKGYLTIAGAGALLWIAWGFHSVPPGHVGYGQLFGRVAWSDLEPGLHWVPPPPVGRFTLRQVDYPRKSDVGFRTDLSMIDLRRRLRQSADPRLWHSPVAAMNPRPGETEYIAGDENLLEMSFTVYWTLSAPYDFFYGLEMSHDVVRLYAQAAAREFVAKRGLDELLTLRRPDIERFVAEELTRRLSRSDIGIRIDSVHLVDIHPPQDAVYAFRDVSSAREDRETRIHEARRTRAAEVPRARGRAVLEEQAARSEADAVTAVAEGTARRFRGQAEAYESAPDVLRHLLWLECSEKVLAGKRKYVLPRGTEGRGVVLWDESPPLPPLEEEGSP